MDTLILFSNNLNQRSLTPTWPLTHCLLRSHVWLYPRIIVSKSHDNTSMYVDTVINFANYHIHTYIHTYIHTHTTYILRTYYVQNEWSHSLLLNSVQARQKGEEGKKKDIWWYYSFYRYDMGKTSRRQADLKKEHERGVRSTLDGRSKINW